MSTNLSTTERIDRTLFTINGNNFKLLNSILLGQKGKDDIRLNPIYVKTYESSKYSDRSELNTVSINTSDFLVLNYFEKVDGDFIKEEIFLSYPHMTSFKEFLNETIGDIFEKESQIYKKNSIAKEYEDLVYISTPLGGGKKIGVYPVKLATEDNDYYNAIGLILNTEENKAVFETDLNTFLTFVEIINDINLTLISNMTLMLGLQIMGTSEGSEVSSSSRKSSIPPRRAVSNPLSRRKTSNEDNDDEGETTPTNKLGSRKVAKSSTPVKKQVSKISKDKLNDILDEDDDDEDDNSSFSLKNIVDEANDIEFNDDDTDLADGAF